MRKLFASLMIVLATTTISSAQETYLDIVINYTPTSMNFGENNDALKTTEKGIGDFRPELHCKWELLHTFQ